MKNLLTLNNLSKEDRIDLEYEVRNQLLDSIFKGHYVVSCIDDDSAVQVYTSQKGMRLDTLAWLQKAINDHLNTL